MARPSNREKILDAFEEILIARGIRETTLDAIAEAADVSKGGLLYHFGTKDELFSAFVDRLLTEIDAVVACAPTEASEVVRWYLNPEPGDAAEAALWRSIIAVLHSTDAVGPDVIRQAFDRFAAPLGVLDPALAEQVRLIGDGLFLTSLLGVAVRPELAAVTEILARQALGHT